MREHSEAYEQFVNEVTAAVREAVGPECVIIPRKERKNNSVMLDGIMLQQGKERVAPNVYLNQYYARYCAGESAKQIAEQILLLCKEKYAEMRRLTETLDFSKEYIRTHLYYRLVSREWNAELLEEIPHSSYLDLAVIYYWVVYEDGEQLGSIQMNYAQMEHLDLSEEELLQLAKENTPRLFPVVVKRMEEIVGEQMVRNMDFPVRVLSNEKGINGAACLMYPGVLEDLKEKMQGSFYVLPSSIHELIVIPANGGEAERLCEMVHCINQTQVPQEDVLSDAVYYYDAEEKAFHVIQYSDEKRVPSRHPRNLSDYIIG